MMYQPQVGGLIAEKEKGEVGIWVFLGCKWCVFALLERLMVVDLRDGEEEWVVAFCRGWALNMVVAVVLMPTIAS